MKTLQLGLGWFPEQAGGLDRFYYDCCHYLPTAGIEIKGLVAGSEKVAQQSQGQIQAFTKSELPIWQRWWAMRQAFEQTINHEDYSVIVSHFSLYTFPILDLIKNRPLVIHFHGPWALEGSREGNKGLKVQLKWLLEKQVYQKASRFIVLSEAFKQLLHQEYQVPKEKIHVIPSGVDLERFQITIPGAVARQHLGWPRDRRVIFAVRRLTKRMGLENLIEAIAHLKEEYPDVLLLIAGKGVLAQSLQKQIEDLQLTDYVRLLGFISDQDLTLAYRAADFSVVPTVSLEGFGLIVIESLAVGTPVLGTPVGGIPEILKPLSADLVFEGHSSTDIAKGIKKVLSGSSQLPSAEVCQAYVKKHYSWSSVAKQIKSVYQAALED